VGRIRDRALVYKIINRPRAGILRAKWLIKLENEKDLEILIRFKERYIKGCHNIVIRRYFLTDKPYIL